MGVKPESSWVGLGIVEFYSMYEYNLFTTNIAKAAFLSMNVFISGSEVY